MLRHCGLEIERTLDILNGELISQKRRGFADFHGFSYQEP